MAGKKTQPAKKWRSQKGPLAKSMAKQARAPRSPESPARRAPNAKFSDARNANARGAHARTAREAREDKENEQMEMDGEYEPSEPPSSLGGPEELVVESPTCVVECPEPEVNELARAVSEAPGDVEENEPTASGDSEPEQNQMARAVSEASGGSAENDQATALAAAPEAAKPKVPKTKVTSWKEDASYREYIALDKKPAACPPFEKEKNSDGHIVVTGEVWCRVPGCNFRPSDDCTGALRKHLSKHGLKSAEQVRTGRTKFGEYDGVKQFYQSLMERHNVALGLIAQVNAVRRAAVDAASDIEDAPIQDDASVDDNAASGRDGHGTEIMGVADGNAADESAALVPARRIRPAGRFVFDGEKLISAAVSGGTKTLTGKLGDRDLERGFAVAIANLPAVDTPKREVGGARAQARQQEKWSAMIRNSGKGKQTRGFKVTGRATFTLDVDPPSPHSGRGTARLANPVSRIDQFVPVGFGANGTPYLQQQMNGALLGNGGMFGAGGQALGGAGLNSGTQAHRAQFGPQNSGVKTADFGGSSPDFVPCANAGPYFCDDDLGNLGGGVGDGRGRQTIRGQAPQRDYSPLGDTVHITGQEGHRARARTSRGQDRRRKGRAQSRAQSPVESRAPVGDQDSAQGVKRRRLMQGRRPSLTSPVSPTSVCSPRTSGAGVRRVATPGGSPPFGAPGYAARGIASSALLSLNLPTSARARNASGVTAGVLGRNEPPQPVPPRPSRFHTAQEEEEHVEEVIRYLIPGHTPAPIDGPQGALDENGNPVLGEDLQERIREARREVRSCLVDYDLYLELE